VRRRNILIEENKTSHNIRSNVVKIKETGYPEKNSRCQHDGMTTTHLRIYNSYSKYKRQAGENMYRRRASQEKIPDVNMMT
jgi:hypothetical protein